VTSAQRFNVKAAIRFFGGPADLSRRANEGGTQLTVKAIEKWSERGQIPGVWIVRLSQLARREGRIFDINDFIIHDKGKGK
jgi:hypothetical protein